MQAAVLDGDGQFGDNVGFLGAQGNFLRSCDAVTARLSITTGVQTVAELLAATGSTNELVTDAVLQALATAELVGVTQTVTVAVAPSASVSKSHVSTPAMLVQLPTLVVALLYSEPVGNESTNCASGAACGPVVRHHQRVADMHCSANRCDAAGARHGQIAWRAAAGHDHLEQHWVGVGRAMTACR